MKETMSVALNPNLLNLATELCEQLTDYKKSVSKLDHKTYRYPYIYKCNETDDYLRNPIRELIIQDKERPCVVYSTQQERLDYEQPILVNRSSDLLLGAYFLCDEMDSNEEFEVVMKIGGKDILRRMCRYGEFTPFSLSFISQLNLAFHEVKFELVTKPQCTTYISFVHVMLLAYLRHMLASNRLVSQHTQGMTIEYKCGMMSLSHRCIGDITGEGEEALVLPLLFDDPDAKVTQE